MLDQIILMRAAMIIAPQRKLLLTHGNNELSDEGYYTTLGHISCPGVAKGLCLAALSLMVFWMLAASWFFSSKWREPATVVSSGIGALGVSQANWHIEVISYHPVEHSFNRHLQIWLIVNGLLKRMFPGHADVTNRQKQCRPEVQPLWSSFHHAPTA